MSWLLYNLQNIEIKQDIMERVTVIQWGTSIYSTFTLKSPKPQSKKAKILYQINSCCNTIKMSGHSGDRWAISVHRQNH